MYFRGIVLSLQSQYDACAIAEYQLPSASSNRALQQQQQPEHGEQAYDTCFPTPAAHVAEAFIRTLPGSQSWMDYTGQELAETDEDLAYLYFRLIVDDRCLLSWGIGDEHDWTGRLTFGIFDAGTDFQGRRILEKRGLFFAMAGTGQAETDFEIRVYRSSARKRIRLLCQKYRETTGSVGLVTAGHMRENETQSMYTYALLDPKDEPYATFRYHCRSAEQLKGMGFHLSGTDEADSLTSTVATSDIDIVNGVVPLSTSAPAVPGDGLTVTHRLSFSPRLHLASSIAGPAAISPTKSTFEESLADTLDAPDSVSLGQTIFENDMSSESERTTQHTGSFKNFASKWRWRPRSREERSSSEA